MLSFYAKDVEKLNKTKIGWKEHTKPIVHVPKGTIIGTLYNYMCK